MNRTTSPAIERSDPGSGDPRPATLRLATGPTLRRVNGSSVGTLHRCPWQWHLREVRKLQRREGEAKPGTVWGTAYHAAIAALLSERALREHPETLGSFHRGPHHFDAAQAALAERGIAPEDELAWRKTVRVAADVCEEAAAAAEEVDAWLAAAGWRVAVVPLGLGGAMVPAVELRLGADFTAGGVAFGGDGRCDTLLVDPRGRLCLVDHKTVDRWPEGAGDALLRDEVSGVDLRDDFQARFYLDMLEARGIRVDRVLHLVRRATVPRPPPLVYKPSDKRHGPSRAKDVETTPDLYRAAVIECGKDPEDYAAEIAAAGLVRWQAWATVEINAHARRLTLPVVAAAVQRMDAYSRMAADDVPRHHVAGRHPGSCARCPDRELCVAEARGARLDADLEIEGRYVIATDRYPDATHVDLETADE